MSNKDTGDGAMTETVNLRISALLKSEIEAIAKASDRTPAQEIRRALRHWANSKEARNA